MVFMTRQALISQKMGPRLFSKPIHALGNHTIRIVRTVSATTMIPKLNTHIRRSYDCMPSSPVSEIRLAAPASPLAFTMHFYAVGGGQTQHKFILLSNPILSSAQETLKNAADVADV